MQLSAIDAPHLWHAGDLQSIPELELSTSQQADLLARLQENSAPAAEQTDRDSLALNSLSESTARMHHELEHGAGFCRLRGVPVERMSYQQAVAAALGIADRIGQVIEQNYEGQRVVDVRDDGIEYSHRSRGYRSNAHLPFHTDGANLFCLLSLGRALEGGETILVSAASAFNRMLAEHPNELSILCEGFFHHRRGQHEPDEAPLSAAPIPVFAVRNELLHCCYNRNPIEWAQKEGVELSAEQLQALDALDAVLADPALQLRFELNPGELLAVNNFIVMHSRTEYRDDAAHKRHLLRIWMNDPNSRWSGQTLLDLYASKRVRARLAVR